MYKSAPTAMADVAPLALEKPIEQSIAKASSVILAKFFSSEDLVSPQVPLSENGYSSSPNNQTDNQTDEEVPGPSSPGERFFSTD